MEIFNKLNWNGKTGRLVFTRYADGNPALVFTSEDRTEAMFSVNIPGFYFEYPFGDYRLIAINSENMGVPELLIESGIIGKPVFTVECDDLEVPICELSDQMVDLLNSYGEYYV